MIALLPVGSRVVIDVLRKGRAMQAIASLAEAMPEELEVPGSIPALSGVTLGTIEPGSRLYGHAEGRSEEHMSELQSLMRISYAVFCLKKKKRNHTKKTKKY